MAGLTMCPCCRKDAWVDGAGRMKHVQDMTDAHLVNTIKYLRRTNKQVVDVIPFPMFQGEMAQYHAENEWFSAMEEQSGINDHAITVLEQEARKRRGDILEMVFGG